MYIKGLFSMRIFILTILLFWMHASYAQPDDRAFAVVAFDSNGYHSNYRMYSCSVSYPNISFPSDSLELVWQPDLKTIKIIDTLRLVKVTNDSTGLPYPYYFEGNSCLMTNILMIISDNKDTMLISTAGAAPYDLVLSPYGHELGLPFIIPFQRGLFYLSKLVEENSTKILFNSAHRDYFLAYYNANTNFASRTEDNRIRYIKMNKQTYFANDTLSIILTGSVLSDGSCGGGNILWTLQKFENNRWIIAIENCCQQMDSAKGPSILNNTTIPLVFLKYKIKQSLMTYPMQIEIPTGKYRFAVYDDIYQLYLTEEFIIE